MEQNETKLWNDIKNPSNTNTTSAGGPQVSGHSFKNTFKRRKFAIILAIVGITLVAVIAITMILIIHDIKETRRLDETSVVLSDNLTAEFGSSVTVSNFIWHLDGSVVNDVVVDTSRLGQTEVEFEYYNIKNKKRKKRFTIDIVDTVAPVIYGQDSYTITVGYDGDLTNLMLSGDNVDDRPIREISGKYDLEKAGDYRLEYNITDASGNNASHPFTLHVVAPTVGSSGQSSSGGNEDVGMPLSEVINLYKNGNTEVGIDVSSWQGEIDWERVSSAGVDFAIIRVGYQADYGGEYILDKTFQDNISNAIAAGVPVGVYYYSCANNIDEARRQADWVISQVQDYPLELGITFDWEEWQDFNRAGMSFYTLEKVADTFLDTVESAGYNGMLYGSKNYLDLFWTHNNYSVWLAQYYNRPTYDKPFHVWQLTDAGQVPGINGYVDLNVRYTF